MNRSVSSVMVAGGIFLLALGYDASRSVGSFFSKVFTGTPSDASIVLLLGGAVLLVSGLFGMRKG